MQESCISRHFPALQDLIAIGDRDRQSKKLTHVAELRTLHPTLKAEEMIAERLTAPLRPVAAMVYKELGLLN